MAKLRIQAKHDESEATRATSVIPLTTRSDVARITRVSKQQDSRAKSMPLVEYRVPAPLFKFIMARCNDRTRRPREKIKQTIEVSYRLQTAISGLTVRSNPGVSTNIKLYDR